MMQGYVRSDGRKGIRNVHHNRMEIIDKMAVGIKDESATSEEIDDAIVDLEKLAIERRMLEKTFLENARQLLEAHQLGKLIVFQERYFAVRAEDGSTRDERVWRAGGKPNQIQPKRRARPT